MVVQFRSVAYYRQKLDWIHYVLAQDLKLIWKWRPPGLLLPFCAY